MFQSPICRVIIGATGYLLEGILRFQSPICRVIIENSFEDKPSFLMSQSPICRVIMRAKWASLLNSDMLKDGFMGIWRFFSK